MSETNEIEMQEMNKEAVVVEKDTEVVDIAIVEEDVSPNSPREIIVEEESKEDKVQEVSTLFNKIYGQIVSTISKKEITAGDLVSIATQAMKLVQKERNLSGPEKKELVVAIITKLVDDSGLLTGKEKEMGDAFIKSTLPVMIDVIVSVAINEIDIGKVKDKCKSCCIVS